jgi:hypothetical protein
MTRRRHSGTVRSAHFAAALCALVLASCASLPDDAPVVEELDQQTGLTVARLGKPLELYRENYREDATGERFAFLGPFETNQMGRRELFLLIGLPEEGPGAPTLFADGTPFDLGPPGNAADFAGLRESPYRIPTPWLEIYYYRVDATTIGRLARASNLRVEVTEETRTGPRKIEYVADVDSDPRLREFAGR